MEGILQQRMHLRWDGWHAMLTRPFATCCCVTRDGPCIDDDALCLLFACQLDHLKIREYWQFDKP